MRPGDAFAICHEVYVHAREMLDGQIGVIRPEASTRYLWRPDNRPRLAEYVADFALAGERALGEPRRQPMRRGGTETQREEELGKRSETGGVGGSASLTTSGRDVRKASSSPLFAEGFGTGTASRSRSLPSLSLPSAALGASGASRTNRASRLILFRLYYLGGAEYHAARHLLGLSERTWADWVEEIRERVGRELIRAGVFPPGRYFRERSSSSCPSGRRAQGTSHPRRDMP